MKGVVTLVALFMGAVVMTHTVAEARSGMDSGAIDAEEEQAKPSGGVDSIKSFRIHFLDEAQADMKRRMWRCAGRTKK